MKYLHWNFLRPHSFVGYWGHSLHASMYMGFGPLFIFACCEWDGLRTPGKIIAFTARPEIQSKSQILRYGQRTFCLPHRPKFFWFMPSLGVHAWTYLLDTAMGHWQFLSLSFVQLKGKHCRKPHCRNGVVDRFGLYSVIIYHSFIQWTMRNLLTLIGWNYESKKNAHL